MDRSRQHSGAFAEMSGLYRRLRCHRWRVRDIDLHGGTSSDGAGDFVRSSTGIFCRESLLRSESARFSRTRAVENVPESCQVPYAPSFGLTLSFHGKYKGNNLLG
jgi:hypothetical protein